MILEIQILYVGDNFEMSAVSQIRVSPISQQHQVIKKPVECFEDASKIKNFRIIVTWHLFGLLSMSCMSYIIYSLYSCKLSERSNGDF